MAEIGGGTKPSCTWILSGHVEGPRSSLYRYMLRRKVDHLTHGEVCQHTGVGWPGQDSPLLIWGIVSGWTNIVGVNYVDVDIRAMEGPSGWGSHGESSISTFPSLAWRIVLHLVLVILTLIFVIVVEFVRTNSSKVGISSPSRLPFLSTDVSDQSLEDTSDSLAAIGSTLCGRLYLQDRSHIVMLADPITSVVEIRLSRDRVILPPGGRYLGCEILPKP